jgi:NodT family efflux transporter outer membrane factor (OMF) lipoprotein
VAAALVTLLSAVACTTVGPDYEAPETVVPAVWHEGTEAGLVSGTAELADWWCRLEDPLLDGLVARATHQNLDLREALARLREARALRGVAASERFPTLDGTAAFERRGESENTPLGTFVPDFDQYSAGFDATWELDLWGRVRRSVESADADLAATVEDTRDVAVTLAAEVALGYVELRSFQRRAAITRSNVSLQEQTLELVRGRYEAGLVGESDVAQARTNAESTRSRLPAFEIGMRTAENRLAVLLGQAPGTLAAELALERAIPVPPLSVAVGVPADLLRRRPDVRRAERTLAAETARIGVAEGELYPRLTLSGSLGVAAEEAADLFQHESGIFGFGPSLRWNLFDAGRLRRLVAAQEARTEQALVRWERTVLLALEESENAMTAFVREQARRRSLLEAATSARLAVELARAQYTEGLSDFQTVLVAERALAELEDELATSDAAITTHLIQLYKALGGGWEEGGLALATAF